MANWRDQIVGARMSVDQEFSQRVVESQFSRQQWGLIMTAVELDIEHPGDPDRARIVADTSKLDHVMSELDKVDQQMAAMGGGSSGGGSSGGIVGSVKQLLGLGAGGGDDGQRVAAESLAQEYATELQTHLESEGRWEQVRRTAAGE